MSCDARLEINNVPILKECHCSIVASDCAEMESSAIPGNVVCWLMFKRLFLCTILGTPFTSSRAVIYMQLPLQPAELPVSKKFACSFAQVLCSLTGLYAAGCHLQGAIPNRCMLPAGRPGHPALGEASWKYPHHGPLGQLLPAPILQVSQCFEYSYILFSYTICHMMRWLCLSSTPGWLHSMIFVHVW